MEMTMMPPDPGMPPQLPIPPGGGGPGMPLPDLDGMNQGPLPAEGGMEGLMALLAGGGGAGMGGAPGMGGLPPEPGTEEPLLGEEEELPPELLQAMEAEDQEQDMDPVQHIRMAMKHLMMAMAADDDDERGAGVTKGMGVLQGLLGGEQKRQKLLESAGG